MINNQDLLVQLKEIEAINEKIILRIYQGDDTRLIRLSTDLLIYDQKVFKELISKIHEGLLNIIFSTETIEAKANYFIPIREDIKRLKDKLTN